MEQTVTTNTANHQDFKDIVYPLSQVLAPVRADLNHLEKELYKNIPTCSKTASKILNHILSSGGKRIRPAAYFLASKLFNSKNKYYMSMAVATEFVHTASLLHDDVIDRSSLRRNKPTAHCIWGDESAILVGDLIYARASELMAETQKFQIVKDYSAAIRAMSEGELLQLEHVLNIDLPIETYIEIIFRNLANPTI